MRKEFNITGTCFPDSHYMMDNTAKLSSVLRLVERGKYFTINRPRQYGKTTTLHFLQERLIQSEGYLPIVLNFQGIDSKWHQSDEVFAKMFVNQLFDFFEFPYPTIAAFIDVQRVQVTDMDSLSKFITRLVHQFDQKLVLLIDEVDASSNYEPFLSFLGMLRTKYLGRKMPHHATFRSIILAGVHDIKSLKYKLPTTAATQYNSPWNIAVDFEVDMSFSPFEIASMLTQYSEEESVKMDSATIAEKLHYHTSGHPFLVSKLCKTIAEKILPAQSDQHTWIVAYVEQAVQFLLKENNTNFDSLIGNLENNKALYDLVARIILEGEVVPFNQYNPTIYKGILYGIFKRNGRVRIHNRIYEQLIYDYVASKMLTGMTQQERAFNYGGYFLTANNGLDMQAVLRKFQSFMKEQRSDTDKDFLERQWRLIFLAFLKPILNGKGHDFKEVETSEEKRLDVVVTFYQHKYILELKIWRGSKNHQKGLDQLADYLDIHGVKKGYLLIFDARKNKAWETKSVTHKNKEIFMVWV